MAKALRVFYRKSDNKIVWTHELRGTGEFPTTVEIDLSQIPGTMPDGKTPLRGVIDDYECIEELDSQKASAFLASDTNAVVNGKLIIGNPRSIIIPQSSRNLAAEIDELKAKIKKLEKI